MYTLIINREAQAEFVREIRYSQKTWGKAHARQYKFDLEAKIYNLKNNPFMNPVKQDISKRVRILKYKGTHVVYTVLESRKEIIILAIQSIYKDITSDVIKRLENP